MTDVRTRPLTPGDFSLAPDDGLPELGEGVINKWKSSSYFQEDLSDDQQAQMLDQFLKWMMCKPTTVPLPDTGRFASKSVLWIPGHVVGDRYGYGPRNADIMLIGKLPGSDERHKKRLWVGPAGRLLAAELGKCGIDMTECYGTNVNKFPAPYPNMKNIPAAWVREGAWFLQQEIRIVQPKFILLLGGDALKAVLGKKAVLRRHRGVVSEVCGAQVMVTNNPADMLRNPEKMDMFQQDLDLFGKLVRGESLQPTDTEYHYLRNLEHLEQVVEMCMESKRFAVDCEWYGKDHDSGHILTIQFSRKSKESFVVVLRSDVRRTEFFPSQSAAIGQLRRLFCRDDVAIMGHNFRSDMKFLNDIGLDVTKQFAENGFDTMLAHHLLMENAEHNLTACALVDTDMGRYDGEMQQYLAKGYIHGTVPEDILLPYAAADTDATFRLYEKYSQQLWEDHLKVCEEAGTDPEKSCYGPEDPRAEEYGWTASLWNLFRSIVMPVNAALDEMEREGVLGDPARIKEMAEAFAKRRDGIVDELRAVIHEQDFNPRSTKDVARLLFGKPGTESKDGKAHMKLGLKPLKTTGKRSKMWDECIYDEEVYYLEEPEYDDNGKVVKEAGWHSNFHAPSTDAETLAVLAEDEACREAELLRNYRFIEQICKTFLPLPEKVEGDEVFTAGLGGAIANDGRIHTTFSQLTETGRFRSAKPNCFSADTEVLTEAGWVLFPEVCERRSLRLAQFDTESETISFEMPTDYIISEDREFVRIETEKQIDLLVTPDHQCLLQNRKTGKFEKVGADCYPQDFRQLQAAMYVGGSQSVREPFLVLMAAMQADSYIFPGGQIEWTFQKERKADRLRWALERCGIRYRESDKDRRDRVRFYVPNGQEFSNWLVSWKNFDSRVLDLDIESLSFLAKEVYFWNGCWSRKSMYSSNKLENADWVQIMHVLTGQRAKIRKYHHSGMKSVNWQVDTAGNSYSLTTNRTVTPQEGKATAYCVTMPAGTVIVRRNGKVAITGQCQNLPKGREGDLAKLFPTADKVPPVRTCLLAQPGCVLVEADFESAELFTLAWLAHDDRMKADLERVDENGEPISLHSIRAVDCFQLDMAVTDFDKRRKGTGAEAKRLSGLRVAAKSVNFGIPYQRGAKAIARQVQREGVPCTIDDAQTWIDSFYSDYDKVGAFIQECKNSVYDPGHLRTPFGRIRHFHESSDEAAMAAQEREACNFPIQSTVADAISMSLRLLKEERDRRDMRFKLVLTVHDSVILEVPYEEVPEVKKILKWIMCDRVVVPNIGLHYGLDIEVFKRWNEKLDDVEILEKCGLGGSK